MGLAERIDRALVRAFPPFGRIPVLFEFFRFCVVGGLGVFVDSAVLIVAVEGFGIPPVVGVLPAFAVAVSFNFTLNRAWTFRSRPPRSGARSYVAFVVVCACGAGLRAAMMSALLGVAFFASGYGYVAANFMGIVAVTLFNFLVSRFVAFPGAARGYGQGP